MAETNWRRHPVQGMSALKLVTRERKRAAVIRAGFRLASWMDRVIVRYSLLGNAPILESARFPWAAELEANWLNIQTEADDVLRQRTGVPLVSEITPDNDYIAKDLDWRSFLFWGYGLRCEENCRRCPQTARLLERIPGLQTAFLSILSPGAHIARHQGISKAVLTCHLGLTVPKDRERCRIQVADHDYAWQEGTAFFFDDMYDHEVWNDTDEERVVLLIYFERPVRFPGSLLRDLVLAGIRRSPPVKEGRRVIEDRAREAAARS